MTLLIAYGSAAILISFLCSILEAVLLSITPTFVRIKKQEGKRFAELLEQQKRDIDQPLIAILTLNTIAHTVGAILVGVQAEKAFGSGDNVVGVVSAIMTVLVLIVSEIIPKTLGAKYWQQLTPLTSRILHLLILLFRWTGVLAALQLFTRLFGGGSLGHSVLSRDDFHAMADIAETEGVIRESESRVLKNLLNFNTILAKDIMTPRSVMKTAPESENIETFFKNNKDLPFSRIPVYAGNTDDITGYILKDDVFRSVAEDKVNLRLADIKREILMVIRNAPIPTLFEQFITNREHIALVVDEYGSISGLVTMEDVIETLLGLEILDESDTAVDMQQLARENWRKRAARLGITDQADTE